MKLLALDSALDAVSAAALVTADGSAERLAVATEPGATGHAERLMDLVAAVLGEAEIDVSALDRIAVTIGPGSFTGVRIALSTARGLGLALGIPVVGITTLAVLAASARGAIPCPVTAAIDARRGLVYAQSFNEAGLPIDAPALLPVDVVATRLAPGAILAGSGAPLIAGYCTAQAHADHPTPTVSPLDVGVLGRLGAAADPASHPPEPLYLRPPDAKPAAPNTLRARPA
ncbi:tRNA (adenosine(37)-N6)-threonylcarbamoyltransferase complex dimerization subunit type 1 TsaB [Segnochrobactrum spirostomi]|uniref:tRNA (Adenosine(37)-N6)-threonylcarbamoyltransferase complex dimerization subunit type 1 TsaB n=1 Tax=Segnochrobactrum spirostomi TaxID=2608987 RepID=A0A6A7Y5I3_9HYPH|nr:tRNA (adenosine(37)-N6)-threonylcarbamoyltransferase complex dimerization subunit type 1 TsaB [Segnochrobactrum spirostomi]MQT12962.1 tRNA (adenosine(37)-N6)-threonylcarbamoyltransferase complex dimerization subunit type 1 TsaB [Segnochrobactrum spirostomi]